MYMDFTLIFGRLGLMEYICMWIFEVYKFEKIDIWHVLSIKKIGRFFLKKKKKKREKLAGSIFMCVCVCVCMWIIKIDRLKTLIFNKMHL